AGDGSALPRVAFRSGEDCRGLQKRFRHAPEGTGRNHGFPLQTGGREGEVGHKENSRETCSRAGGEGGPESRSIAEAARSDSEEDRRSKGRRQAYAQSRGQALRD